MGGRALRLGWARGPSAAARSGWGVPSAAARTDLGNCTFWKLPLGKNPLGKYLTLKIQGGLSSGEQDVYSGWVRVSRCILRVCWVQENKM